MTDAEKMPWVIFDIDGTLADITHRLHHIKGEKKDWDAFNSEIESDSIKPDVKALYDLCHDAGYNIMIVTGRFEKFRVATNMWLNQNGITFQHLHMRADGDYRSDFEVKQDIYEDEVLLMGREITFTVDDRDRVVEMWRANGLTCLQVQKGDY